MKSKAMVFITAIVILIPMFVGLILWNQLPNEIAIHFDTSGNADNYCYKGLAIFGIPLFILAAQFFCLFMTAHDPKGKNISDKIYKLVIWICPICSMIGGIIMYSDALDVPFPVFSILQAVIGIAIILIGNFLPKSRQNYTIGIRLPWTLNDKENWNSTHRFAGKVWIAGGLILVINAFLNNWIISLVVILFLVVIPCIYSFTYHKKHKNVE